MTPYRIYFRKYKTSNCQNLIGRRGVPAVVHNPQVYSLLLLSSVGHHTLSTVEFEQKSDQNPKGRGRINLKRPSKKPNARFAARVLTVCAGARTPLENATPRQGVEHPFTHARATRESVSARATATATGPRRRLRPTWWQWTSSWASVKKKEAFTGWFRIWAPPTMRTRSR